METRELEDLAQKLHRARLDVRPVEQLSHHVKISRAEAYTIQELGAGLRTREGETTIGLKMGLTSEGKRRQMNLDTPLYGVLTEKMAIADGGTLSLAPLIHPKIEPELAFVISRQLKGAVSRDEVLDACSEVRPCMEILDSRYTEFRYFSMEDVIADNSSSSHFVLGPPLTDFRKLDLSELTLKMSVNGEVVQQGLSKEISGDPLLSVVQLCELLAAREKSLPAGSVVLAGAATAAVALKPETRVALDIEGHTGTSVQILP